MNWLKTSNQQLISLNSIPLLPMNDWQDAVKEMAMQEMRPLLLITEKFRYANALITVMADDKHHALYVNAGILDPMQMAYPSLAKHIPAFNPFERELYEASGIRPEGHPWLKNLRYPFNRPDPSQTMTNYPFYKVHGEEIHEVAVGPVHAGVIEPGHFRFMCHGENIEHLEIQLGYQHRGIESLLPQLPLPHLLRMAESIAGDSVVAHTLCAATAVEALSSLNVSRPESLIRAIALELERIAMHIADLAALGGDVAYMIGNAVLGARRTLVINLLLQLCGSRFARGLIRLGGTHYRIDSTLQSEIKAVLNTVRTDVCEICDYMFAAPSVLSRFEGTGTVTCANAQKAGLVGLAARASGLKMDCRKHHPDRVFAGLNFEMITHNSGDVFARAQLRYLEILQSLDLIRELFNQLDHAPNTLYEDTTNFTANALVISMTEGWRGEVVHTLITDSTGKLSRYKIKDPSFNNWIGLALAVRGNGISDFPLCNKSFNLSYCGHDL